MEAIRLIRDATGTGLRESKATVLHLVRNPGHCHKCQDPLPSGDLVECPGCRSLNIVL
jgi:hypothetical protein